MRQLILRALIVACGVGVLAAHAETNTSEPDITKNDQVLVDGIVALSRSQVFREEQAWQRPTEYFSALRTMDADIEKLTKSTQAEPLFRALVVTCERLRVQKECLPAAVQSGLQFMVQRQIEKAQLAYSTAERWAESAPASNDQWAVYALNGLGIIEYYTGEFSAAEQNLQRVASILPQGDSIVWAVNLDARARILVATGRPLEGARLSESALEITERVAEQGSEDYVLQLESTAQAEGVAGLDSDAIKHLQLAEDVAVAGHGPTVFYRGSYEYWIAWSLLMLNDLQGAEMHVRRALQMQKPTAPQSQDVGDDDLLLADVLTRSSRAPEEAEALLREAIAIRTKRPFSGLDQAQLSLVTFLATHGRIPEARSLYDTIQRSPPEPNKGVTATPRHQRHNEAVAWETEARSLCEGPLGALPEFTCSGSARP